MGILYELEFDLDGFIESMEKQYPARRRIEEHLEKRRLREELAPFSDEPREKQTGNRVGLAPRARRSGEP